MSKVQVLLSALVSIALGTSLSVVGLFTGFYIGLGGNLPGWVEGIVPLIIWPANLHARLFNRPDTFELALLSCIVGWSMVLFVPVTLLFIAFGKYKK